MWVINKQDGRFQVGYWAPNGSCSYFVKIIAFDTYDRAAKEVHYLNGGDHVL